MDKVSTPQAQRFRYDRVRMDSLSGVMAHLLAGQGKTCNTAG
jgi:ADP-dependent phosphofructokinase/glucokinase